MYAMAQCEAIVVLIYLEQVERCTHTVDICGLQVRDDAIDKCWPHGRKFLLRKS